MDRDNHPFTHRFIAGNSPESPTLLLLHGTGGNEDSLIEVGQELLPGAHLLSPRGKVLEHGMPRFFRRLAEGVFDVEDVHKRTAELRDFITEAREKYNLATSPFYAVGYSNGANIAVSLLLSFPDVLAGAVLFRPMLPFRTVTRNANEVTTSVLMLNGEHDPLVPRDNALVLKEELERHGMTVDLKWLPTGHQLGFNDMLHAQQWLAAQTQASI